MHTTVMSSAKTRTFIALGLAMVAMGIPVAQADDAPGAAVLGMLLMVAGLVLGLRTARHRLPRWAGRTALATGVVAAALVALVAHRTAVTAPLFPPQSVPSVLESAPPPAYASAVERARDRVRAAIVQQNVPGLSVAVGADGAIVWAEGFGWRDVLSRAPVTPATRFNIGSAASAVSSSVAQLGLTDTGIDPVQDWSPSHLGEPEDDFPPFTLIRHVVFRPIGLAPDRPLPGNRATFYVPSAEDNPLRGRREMYMRDMECCPNRTAFYSTPSDLVRVAMATRPGSIDGQLAGGLVMSLVGGRDDGIAIAVTSNIAHADTASLARAIGDVFAGASNRR